MTTKLTVIFDQDYHKVSADEKVPLWLETPAIQEFIPSIVSSSYANKFLVVRKLTSDNKIRSGIYKQEQVSFDEVASAALRKAYELSRSDKYKNIFNSLEEAFKYIQQQSGSDAQPHLICVPSKMTDPALAALDLSLDSSRKFKGISKVLSYEGDVIVVCSRPDFVGLYTTFSTGRASLLLHNVSNGLAFVVT